MYIFEKYSYANARFENTAIFSSKEEGVIYSFFDEDNLSSYTDVEFRIYNENLEKESSELEDSEVEKIFIINNDFYYDEYEGFLPTPIKKWKGSLRENKEEIISFLQNYKEDKNLSSENLNKFLEDIKIFEEEQARQVEEEKKYFDLMK